MFSFDYSRKNWFYKDELPEIHQSKWANTLRQCLTPQAGWDRNDWLVNFYRQSFERNCSWASGCAGECPAWKNWSGRASSCLSALCRGTDPWSWSCHPQQLRGCRGLWGHQLLSVCQAMWTAIQVGWRVCIPGSNQMCPGVLKWLVVDACLPTGGLIWFVLGMWPTVLNQSLPLVLL